MSLDSLSANQAGRSGGAGDGTVAKDTLGNDVIAAEWLQTHGPGDRTLTQGLKIIVESKLKPGHTLLLEPGQCCLTPLCYVEKMGTTECIWGDPTYLVVENDRTLATFGINAVCTHLGCVVPWNSAENKFICPCHGSQYNNQGRVVRGPAPLLLALAHADIDDGNVLFIPWVETDFRTVEAPWWA
ncbi:hypothetical protein LOK49_LG06G00656 [Camellia lanceoleosa]|uniref:Uncharacterized protein n=1 Tax=Camellia lanceoleosa TaxID=1840588 RepID=A0ACC0H8S2_9ERIC|nr:hypothetical protein LOK49_LG06G00656 [Camellia lanceoleosa]